MLKKRDFSILGIAKREINARPKIIKNKKAYTRKVKHKNKWA
jgi:hypothetical protein